MTDATRKIGESPSAAAAPAASPSSPPPSKPADDPALRPPPPPTDTGMFAAALRMAPALSAAPTAAVAPSPPTPPLSASVPADLRELGLDRPVDLATMPHAAAVPATAEIPPDTSDRPIIEMIDLTVKVKGRTLIEGANISIHRGEVVLLVGGSGTGKSVLMKILLGLIHRDTPGFAITGKLLVAGRDVLSGLAGREHSIGIVFQDYALFDELTVADNLNFAFDHAPTKWSAEERKKQTDRLVQTLSLNLHTPISRMSGGERRRVAIARTLAYDPDILLYDEPTTGLDPLNSERVADLIGASARTFAKTSLVITHDYEYLRRVADRVLLIDPENQRLTELSMQDATVDFVKDRLKNLRPPKGELDSPLRVAGDSVTDFFATTSKAAEAALIFPFKMLAWPFTIGLTLIGALLVLHLLVQGTQSATAEPTTSATLIGLFGLGAVLMLVADFRASRWRGISAVAILGGLSLAALVTFDFAAAIFAAARDGTTTTAAATTATAEPAAGESAKRGLQAAELGRQHAMAFFGALIPGLFACIRLLRLRWAAVALSMTGAVVLGVWCLEAAFGRLGKVGLLETIALDVPSLTEPVTFTFLSSGAIFLLLGLGFFSGGATAPFRLARQRWGGRFFWHYLKLVALSTSIPYLAAAGFITGFVATFFIYRYFPFRDYTEPLIVDDILHAIGFILFRVLIPLVGTVLIAARCGAAVAADIGNRVYTHQGDALRTFGVNPNRYWAQNVLWAFLIGGPLLILVAFIFAAGASLIAFLLTHPGWSVSFWWQHFTWELKDLDAWMPRDVGWLIAKILVCSAGTAAISTGFGMRPKESALSVSRGITQTILWATLFVLMTHLLFAFFEFRELKPPQRPT